MHRPGPAAHGRRARVAAQSHAHPDNARTRVCPAPAHSCRQSRCPQTHATTAPAEGTATRSRAQPAQAAGERGDVPRRQTHPCTPLPRSPRKGRGKPSHSTIFMNLSGFAGHRRARGAGEAAGKGPGVRCRPTGATVGPTHGAVPRQRASSRRACPHDCLRRRGALLAQHLPPPSRQG